MGVKILGEVTGGKKLGRRIGFPTANIRLNGAIEVVAGVYAVRVMCRGQILWGVANLGVRPTVDSDNQMVLEVNIFDFDDDIYSESVEVELLERLRDEQRFDSVEQLKEQIGHDVAAAKEVCCRWHECEDQKNK